MMNGTDYHYVSPIMRHHILKTALGAYWTLLSTPSHYSLEDKDRSSWKKKKGGGKRRIMTCESKTQHEWNTSWALPSSFLFLLFVISYARRLREWHLIPEFSIKPIKIWIIFLHFSWKFLVRWECVRFLHNKS